MNPPGSSKHIHIALLRGINVGGRNKLPMRELADIFERAGALEVRTWIQSGNVIFRASPGDAERIGQVAVDTIEKQFDFRIPLVLRSAAELKKTIASNPFAAEGVDGKELHVAFLADRPGAAKVARLDPDRSPPDDFVVSGHEVYLRLPNGVARTKFTNAYLDSRLETTSTMRNWKTTLKLLVMAEGG